MLQMTSNSKHESIMTSEELGTTDETAALDATGEEVGLVKGYGMRITEGAPMPLLPPD